MKRVEYLMSLVATTGTVEDWVWEGVAQEYLFDEETRERMRELNPTTLRAVVDRLLKAYEWGYWGADEGTVREIERLRRDLS